MVSSNLLMEIFSIIIFMIREEIIFRKIFSQIFQKIISVYPIRRPLLNYRRSRSNSRLIISSRTPIVKQIPKIDQYFLKITPHLKIQVPIKILIIISTMEILQISSPIWKTNNIRRNYLSLKFRKSKNRMIKQVWLACRVTKNCFSPSIKIITKHTLIKMQSFQNNLLRMVNLYNINPNCFKI